MRHFLRAVVVIGTDAQTSEAYGRIRSELSQAGLLIPKPIFGLPRSPCSTGFRSRPAISISAELPASGSCPGEPRTRIT